MKIPLYLDTETYSPISLTTCGTHRYAEEVDIIMWQYAIGDGEVVVKDSFTPELRALLADEQYEIVIHNSHFDRTVIRHAIGIEIPTNRIFDTMACAMAHSLPGGLEQLCDILNISKDKSKDKDGKNLIRLFCMPQKVKGSDDVYRATKETHPAEWERFRNYGRLDIEAMRQVYKMLPRWNFKGFERELWELDQEINDRGVYVDLKLANAAIALSKKTKAKHDEDTFEQTEGQVATTNRRQALIDYIKSAYHIDIEDLKAPTVRKLLDSDLPPEVLSLLSIRLDASKTSSAKYKRVVDCVSKDSRLRGLLQFCGALRTGRWAGRMFQPQNLPRPTIKRGPLDIAIGKLIAGEHLENPSEVCSSAIRGVICAPQGKKLVIADLSNIEGRKLAWLANEKWKLKAFRDFDAGMGSDLYKLAYAKAFGIPVEEVTDDQRQIGKVMELAFGYGGGIGAWITFATAFGIDLEALADIAFSTIPGEILAESENFYHWFKKQGKSTYGLSMKAFIVCDGLKRLWREAHPNIVRYWKDLETTCIKAVDHPGQTFIVNYHKVRRDGAWLRIGLPSGRCLCYPAPLVEDGKLSYMGINQFTRKWSRIKTYGGKLAENITQAGSKDILAHGMVEAKKDGYALILTVHDEPITETPDTDEYTVEGLIACITKPPIWAIDLPLAADGFETIRYGKK